MFTGIIEATSVIKKITENGSNKTLTLSSPLAGEFKVDQSISHNGVCLTVEAIEGTTYTVTAISETLQKTNLGLWNENDMINLERSMVMNGRLDGHIIQGHVDTTAKCIALREAAGSWEYTFEFPTAFAELVIEKGSICINGISLTLFNVTNNSFSVAVIPYTYNHTNISQVREGGIVNVEFDIIGKYAQRLFQLRTNNAR